MKTYVTFGQDHVHKLGNKTFDRNSVAEIDCETFEEGRAKAFELFGKKFCTTYTDLKKVHLEYYPRGIIKIGS
jgi:hypothetical protein